MKSNAIVKVTGEEKRLKSNKETKGGFVNGWNRFIKQTTDKEMFESCVKDIVSCSSSDHFLQ